MSTPSTWADALLPFGLDLAAKAALVLFAALLVHALLGRRRSLACSALWNATLVALLLLPVACVLLPRWRLTCLPAPPSPSDAAPVVADAEISSGGEPTPRTLAPPRWEMVPPPMEPGTGPRLNWERAEVRAIAAMPAPAQESAPSAKPPAPSARPPAPWRWPEPAEWIVAAYAFVLIGRLFGLIAGLAAVRRLRRRADPVLDPRWVAALKHWRSRLGVRRGVELRTARELSVPIAVGVWRPVVLVPAGMVDATSNGLIDSVLLHELAHVRRGDCAANLLLRLVQAVYWPHPLVWIAARLVHATRERACDDYCIHMLGDKRMYRTTLLDVAEALARRRVPAPALGLAMARRTQLGRRLAWIDRSPGAARCRPHGLLAAALLGVTLAATALAAALQPVRAAARPAAANQDAPRATEPARTDDPPAKAAAAAVKPKHPARIEVTVTAQDTGKPIAGAIVRFAQDFTHKEVVTDADGRAIVDRSGVRITADWVSFDVWADGYVQQRHSFSDQLPSDEKPIPEAFTVSLLPATESFGGIVRNENGEPVEGATVELWGWLKDKKDPNELAYMIRSTTDAEGRWRNRSLRNMVFINLYIKHPDYLSDGSMQARGFGKPNVDDPPPDFGPLRDGTDVQIIKKGVPVEGRVVDEAGNPIAGANVGWADSEHDFEDDLIKTTTDAEGRFHFLNVRPGERGFLAKAPGRSLGLVVTDVEPGMKPVELRLPPGRVLKGRVEDHLGNPIAGAFVNVDTWRRYRGFGIYLTTDADGRFVWDQAPEDEVEINISEPGYLGPTWLPVVAGENELTYTLRPSLEITGRVKDAETDKRIQQADVEIGSVDAKTGEVKWSESPRGFVHDGRLQVSLDATTAPAFYVRIVAGGYEPLVSPEYPSGAGRVKFDVALKKSETKAGRVVDPDGKPLAGATVYLLKQNQSLNLSEDPSRYYPDGLKVTSEEDGTIRLPPVAGPYAIVADHEKFYGAMSKDEFEKERTLTVSPWGRVEGVLKIGSRIGANEPITLSREPTDRFLGIHVWQEEKATTDESGRFAFERVVPGAVRIGRDGGRGTDRESWDIGQLFVVRSGETTRAQVGGIGRPLVGRLIPPEGTDDPAKFFRDYEVQLESNKPYFPYPLEFVGRPAGMRSPEWSTWGNDWRESDEGRAYLRHYVRRTMRVARDGSFRFDDVPPGAVRLAARLHQDARRRTPRPGPMPLHVETVTIPEVPGGQSDEPIDLGALDMWTFKPLEVGKAAPDFEVTTTEGRKLTLADFRGKFLLLDFGAPYSQQSRFQVGRLAELWARHSGDARLAVLSLTVDADTPEVRSYIAEKLQSWPQAIIGPQSPKNAMARAYGIDSSSGFDAGLPQALLIGPDGTLIGKDLWYKAIEEAVVRALNGDVASEPKVSPPGAVADPIVPGSPR
jgi:beta-lactamase regulating signal transducer with metallopeptidase domain/protocatechuate 3,4-dioxygenase beta subunit